VRTRGEWPPPGATDNPSRALNWLGDEAVTNDRFGTSLAPPFELRGARMHFVTKHSAGIYVSFLSADDGFRFT